MGAINFEISYKEDRGSIITPSELLDLYFYGIPIVDKLGNKLSTNTIQTYINAAQEEVEKFLGIKLAKQIIAEDRDFNLEDWRQWGYLRTSFPVSKVFELKGFINTVQQMDIPKEWISSRKSSDGLYFRQIHVVPVAISSMPYSTIYNGVVPLGYTMNTSIPNYWKVVYCTGFDKIPHDLLSFIGKLAAINVFYLMGDLILGPGLSSKSVSIDGVSQSLSISNNGYGARIKGYLADIEKSRERLYNYYKGFTVASA